MTRAAVQRKKGRTPKPRTWTRWATTSELKGGFSVNAAQSGDESRRQFRREHPYSVDGHRIFRVRITEVPTRRTPR